MTEDDNDTVDTDEYYAQLRESESVPDKITQSLPPKENYGERVDPREINQEILDLVIDWTRRGRYRDSSTSYYGPTDEFVLGAGFVGGEDLAGESEYTDAIPPRGGDSLVIEDCPLCGETHLHDLKPPVILGGVGRYRCPCENSYAPETYLIVLRDLGYGVPYETIHWACGEFRKRYDEIEDHLAPDGVSKFGEEYVEITSI